MKKIIIFVMMLVCVGCTTEYKYIEREDFPQAIMGTLPNGLDIMEAEDIISNVCIRLGWNITSRAEGWMVIYKAGDFYDLYGSITYNENNYTISMDNITAPKQTEYEHRRVSTDEYVVEKKRFKLFSKHASKLARSIQKYGMRTGIRAQKYDAYKQRGRGNTSPIIINNNVGK